MSAIKGNISVVGSAAPASSASSASSAKSSKYGSDAASREKQLAAYRDQLRQLRNQLEATDKKLSDLRNFKGNSTSSSGGINVNQRYSMPPSKTKSNNSKQKRYSFRTKLTPSNPTPAKTASTPATSVSFRRANSRNPSHLFFSNESRRPYPITPPIRRKLRPGRALRAGSL